MTVLLGADTDGQARNGLAPEKAADRALGPPHRRWPVLCVTTALVTLTIVWASWLISGGGLFFVGSPSMGTAAPVGSLVVTQPLGASAKLHVGQIIVFEPHPGRSLTYVHRVYELLPRDRYLTKGDLNQGPDPWVLTRGDVIGTVNLIVPAIGWIYKCATWLFLGTAVLVAVSVFVARRQRLWILACGPVVLLVVPLLKYRPFIGGYLYGSGRRGRLLAAKVVDTGILPVHFTPHAGHAVHAVPGQEVLVSGVTPSHTSSLNIKISAALPWWGWAIACAVCLSPLMVVLARDHLVRRRERLVSESPIGLGTSVSQSDDVLTTAR